MMAYAAKQGKRCVYLSFEEPADHLRQHMKDFGWDPTPLERKGLVHIQRVSPVDVERQIEALVEKSRGELLIDVKPIIFSSPEKIDYVFVDSLTAIESMFSGKEENYRTYVEQFFRLLEDMQCASFLIAENTEHFKHETDNTEEFLADGIIILYNLQQGSSRTSALEIFKMRGSNFSKKIIPFTIGDAGITAYPDDEVFEADK